MSALEVDRYLSQFEGSGLVTALRLRQTLLELLPGAEEGISYSMPVVKISGQAIAGYAIAKNHVGYYPHSSMVLDKVPELQGRYKMTKGALHIPNGEVLEPELVRKLVLVRLEQLNLSHPIQ